MGVRQLTHLKNIDNTYKSLVVIIPESRPYTVHKGSVFVWKIQYVESTRVT